MLHLSCFFEKTCSVWSMMHLFTHTTHISPHYTFMGGDNEGTNPVSSHFTVDQCIFRYCMRCDPQLCIYRSFFLYVTTYVSFRCTSVNFTHILEINLKLWDSGARNGGGKVSPPWTKLHTLSQGHEGQRPPLERTAPLVTAAINVLLRNSMCPAGHFAPDSLMSSWI